MEAAGNPAVDSDSAIRAAKRMAKLRRWHEQTVQEWAPLHEALGEWLMRWLVPAPKEKEPKQLWENRVAHFKQLMRSTPSTPVLLFGVLEALNEGPALVL